MIRVLSKRPVGPFFAAVREFGESQEKPRKPVLEHGSLCVEDDECQTLDPDAAEPWVCVDTCN